MTLDDALAGLEGRDLSADGSRPSGQWVAGVLRGLIAAGVLPPGTKLTESTLARALGVSRTVLREGFLALAAERMVNRVPHRGVFVAYPSLADVQETFRVRRHLEPAALLWAPASDADCNLLDAAVSRAQVARTARDVPGMADANQDFHAGLVALAGSTHMDRLMQQVLAEMRLLFHAVGSETVFHAPFLEDNARILELLRIGERQEAADLMIRYLSLSEEQLLAALTDAVPATSGSA